MGTDRGLDAGPARADLARLVPGLAWGTEATAAAASGQDQGRLFELLLGVVERSAASAPLPLVMEDLHWADRSTRDLVTFLATYLRTGRILLTLSFRSDELHRLHPRLLGTDPPTRLLDDIYARSEGNPFLAEELVLAAERTPTPTLPHDLREVLLSRVVQLGRGAQLVQLIHLGQAEAGLAERAAAVRLAAQAGSVVDLMRATRNHAAGLLATGRATKAATVALDGIQQARRLGLVRSYGLPDLAAIATEALMALGRWDEADRVSREGLEIAPADAATVGLPLARAALELGLGDLDGWRPGTSSASPTGSPTPASARPRRSWPAPGTVTRRPSSCVAADITGRLGARPLDSEVKALAKRTRLDVASAETATAARVPNPARQPGLTPREVEVLALVAAGHSNSEIAQRLFISPRTASVHVSNILAKLGVSTRVQAAAAAHRLGLDKR